MKKIITFISCFVLLITIAGCEFVTSDTPAVYKITYYNYDGSVLRLYPDSYQSGETFALPTLKDIGESKFCGWYVNNSGLPITEVDETRHASLKLYAAFDPVVSLDPTDPTPEKEDIDLSKYAPTSFEATFSNGTIYKQTGDASYVKTNNIEYTFVKQNNGTYNKYSVENYAIKEENLTKPEYDNLIKIYYNLNFSALVGKFELIDGSYSIVGDDANTILQSFFNSTTKYQLVDITVTNNMISVVSAITNDNLSETVTFKKIDKIDLSVVDPIPTNDYPVNDALLKEDGETVIVIGKIIGTIGNNFYLSDGIDGIYIYPNNTNYHDITSYGNVVKVKGTITTYNGLREIQNITSIAEVDNNIKYDIEAITFNDLDKYPSLAVNLTNLTLSNIKTLTSDFGTGNKDAIIEVSALGKTVSVMFHKNLNTSLKSSLYQTLKASNVGDSITLNNVIVSYYKGIQIAFTDQSTINVKPYVESGLFASTTNIIAEVGTTLDDLLKDITFYYIDETGNKEYLKLTDLEMTDYDSSFIGNQSILFGYLDEILEINVRLYEDTPAYRPTNVEVLDDILPYMCEEDGYVYGVTSGIPNVGNPKVLIIPVTFTNYEAPANMKENLEKAFFGTSEETGWESLQSYYLKSSFGKLNIEGTVLEPFNTGKRSTYYDTYEDTEAVNMIIKAALSYYDNEINYNEYDTDNDGYIDAVYLVYSCPVNYDDADSLYWAFSYEYYTEDYEYYDDVEADYYCFLGYDFLFEELASGEYVTLNAETIIHESGHLLGLDDYYDYDDTTGPDGGLGGSDMMDYNIGDHNAYSKAILGWINPYVVDGYDITLEIGKANATGDAIIVTNKWNDTYFDEYLLIEYFTPDGLNALEAGYSGQFTIPGIKIYHVSAALNDPTEVYDQWTVTKDNNSDTKYKLICYIEADGNNDISSYNDYSDNADLFTAGTSYTLTSWYYSGSTNIKISIISLGETAKISIEFK